MKKFLEKTCKILGIVYGYGILVTLIASGLTFFGYVVALCIGGDVAAQICEVIYKHVFKWIIIVASCVVLLGLIKMYLAGEVQATVRKKRAEAQKKREERNQRRLAKKQTAVGQDQPPAPEQEQPAVGQDQPPASEQEQDEPCATAEQDGEDAQSEGNRN